jgi:LuxR family glucitol operon transcriptional activator
LKQLAKLMLPYPRSRHFAVTLDGIGGVGKSALALEFAHRHREHYAALTEDERFEAIVWVTAKRTLLTASGIQQRQQTFSTLADLYREIANVLEVPAILQVDMEQQRTLVERALSNQRTLLVIDNLETVDDEELLTFIRELPDPTKVIVTTRHRIDIAMPIRVLGMPYDDAHELMSAEAASKQIELTAEDVDNLFRRTAGVPLALVWSIALMSLGHGVEAVLRRLGSGHSDIARFCFTESIEHIRDRDAYRLLLALALFEYSVNRVMLGEVAGLGDDEIGRDDGLVALEQLSLVNKEGDRFSLLPLTRTFALEELKKQTEIEQEIRRNWIDVLVTLAKPYADLVWRQEDRRALHMEGTHLMALFAWYNQSEQPDVLLAIIPAVLGYLDIKGQWGEIPTIAQIGLEYAKLTGNLKTFTLISTHTMAWILSHQGCQEEAERHVIEAFDAAQQMENIAWQCEVLIHYSQILRRSGRMEEALIRCHEALSLADGLYDPSMPFVRAEIEYELGKIARDKGDWHVSREHFLAARDIFRTDEDEPPFNLEFAMGIYASLGFVSQQLGDLQAASQIYAHCLRVHKRIS